MKKKKKVALIIGIVIGILIIMFIALVLGGVLQDEIDKQQIANLNTELTDTQNQLQTLKSNSINLNTLDTIPVGLVLNTVATQKISQAKLDSLNPKQADVIEDLIQYSITYNLDNMN